MDGTLETAWMKTVNCAISNSIDYHSHCPTVIFCSAELLESSVCHFIMKYHNCERKQASVIYSDCLENAKRKKCADGQYPLWVISGLYLGLALGAVEIINFITVGFTWVFLLFFFIAVSLCKTCIQYVSAERSVRSAAKVWKKSINKNTVDTMERTLERTLEVMYDIILHDTDRLKIKLDF